MFGTRSRRTATAIETSGPSSLPTSAGAEQHRLNLSLSRRSGWNQNKPSRQPSEPLPTIPPGDAGASTADSAKTNGAPTLESLGRAPSLPEFSFGSLGFDIPASPTTPTSQSTPGPLPFTDQSTAAPFSSGDLLSFSSASPRSESLVPLSTIATTHPPPPAMPPPPATPVNPTLQISHPVEQPLVKNESTAIDSVSGESHRREHSDSAVSAATAAPESESPTMLAQLTPQIAAPPPAALPDDSSPFPALSPSPSTPTSPSQTYAYSFLATDPAVSHPGWYTSASTTPTNSYYQVAYAYPPGSSTPVTYVIPYQYQTTNPAEQQSSSALPSPTSDVGSLPATPQQYTAPLTYAVSTPESGNKQQQYYEMPHAYGSLPRLPYNVANGPTYYLAPDGTLYARQEAIYGDETESTYSSNTTGRPRRRVTWSDRLVTQEYDSEDWEERTKVYRKMRGKNRVFSADSSPFKSDSLSRLIGKATRRDSPSSINSSNDVANTSVPPVSILSPSRASPAQGSPLQGDILPPAGSRFTSAVVDELVIKTQSIGISNGFGESDVSHAPGAQRSLLGEQLRSAAANTENPIMSASDSDGDEDEEDLEEEQFEAVDVVVEESAGNDTVEEDEYPSPNGFNAERLNDSLSRNAHSALWLKRKEAKEDIPKSPLAIASPITVSHVEDTGHRPAKEEHDFGGLFKKTAKGLKMLLGNGGGKKTAQR
ncbi:hypothetical protein BJ742DRAFT_779897 [Cladochytrium replicatum]|nr:hypothetical protein BJ742DRAFT_779897 [Cladochytrium replicatum]